MVGEISNSEEISGRGNMGNMGLVEKEKRALKLSCNLLVNVHGAGYVCQVCGV